MRFWRSSESDDNPKRRSSDQDTYTKWAVGIVGSVVLAGAMLYVQGIAGDAKDALKKAELVSKDQAKTEEAVKRIEDKIEDFKTEQRATNKEIKETAQKTLDLLIRMDRKNNR